jgi:predicted  nucleic acid-binding Zn-ribbon protein
MGDDRSSAQGCNTPCADIQKIKEQVNNHEKRLDRQEILIEKNDKDINKLQVTVAEFKVAIKGIEDKIDGLDNKLFSYLNKLADGDDKERKEWIGLIEKIIKWTVAALIGYIFAKGGF